MNAHQIGRCFDRQQLLLGAFLRVLPNVFSILTNVRNRAKNFPHHHRKKPNLCIDQCYAIKPANKMRFSTLSLSLRKRDGAREHWKQILTRKVVPFSALEWLPVQNPVPATSITTPNSSSLRRERISTWATAASEAFSALPRVYREVRITVISLFLMWHAVQSHSHLFLLMPLPLSVTWISGDQYLSSLFE